MKIGQKGAFCKGLKLILIIYIALVCLSTERPVFGREPPYPASPIIESIHWDFSSLKRMARGSDLFPLTWARDGNLYTTWGDGWGFNESGRKHSLGVSRITKFPESCSGNDLWHEIGKSPGGIISINGVLYLYVTEQNKWTRCKLWKSTNNGVNWIDLGWIFDEPGGVFAAPGLIQFGQDYAGARDSYVYGYSEGGISTQNLGIENKLFLFRVPKDKLASRSHYEFFAGMDINGNPIWSLNINEKAAVFTDSNGIGWGVNASYHIKSGRYLLTVRHDDTGGWGIFDSPEPWGPWTTIAYYDNWIDSIFKFCFVFTQKWTSADGKILWMVFSGTGKYDSFNLIKATLIFKSPTNCRRQHPIQKKLQ